MPEFTYYLSIGSNIENRISRIRSCLPFLSDCGFELKDVSGVYETRPLNDLSSYPFLNLCVKAKSSLEPQSALLILKRIERIFGRHDTYTKRRRHSERPLDIDLVLSEEVEVKTDRVILPHPDFNNRSFVVFPLYEILDRKSHYFDLVSQSYLRFKLKDPLGIKMFLRKDLFW
ncbi:MAG: 2-amino-4-hydroxy-6-hydroxymethyldihydropteridine diphosphokinase [Actinobacteria bacterium]|nr:2-amino-4-hydroxy-6-hydroxymethyldihydropteridine diphosphokinase [Actinomycetota bacterium]